MSDAAIKMEQLSSDEQESEDFWQPFRKYVLLIISRPVTLHLRQSKAYGSTDFSILRPILI